MNEQRVRTKRFSEKAIGLRVFQRRSICLSLICSFMLAGCKLPVQESASSAAMDAAESPESALIDSNVVPDTVNAELASSQSYPQENLEISSKTTQSSSRSIRLKVGGIQPKSGPVRVAIFSGSDSFPNHETATIKVTFVSDSSNANESIENIPSGPIAIAVYQDLNNDGQLNRGTFGIPVEPYGFSNNAKGSMGPPSFSAAEISQSDKLPVEVTLTKLSF